MGQLRGELLHFVKTNGRTMQWGSMVERTLRRSLRPSWSRSSWPWAGPVRYRSNQAGWSKGTYVGGRPMVIVSGCARWSLACGLCPMLAGRAARARQPGVRSRRTLAARGCRRGRGNRTRRCRREVLARGPPAHDFSARARPGWNAPAAELPQRCHPAQHIPSDTTPAQGDRRPSAQFPP